jgi:hypothetical protein
MCSAEMLEHLRSVSARAQSVLETQASQEPLQMDLRA